MKTFDTTALRLTPLSPIHIGCSVDFEPTNYVIDEGVLFHFDPARVPLTQADQDDLKRALNGKATEVILAMQRYFYSRADRFKPAAHVCIPVSPGVEEWYASRVGKVVQRESGNKDVGNQLEIERTAHHPHTGRPYLPGSSIKGAIRTAWLNHLDEQNPVRVGKREPEKRAWEKGSDIETELLGGSFATDPFRLVKLSDAQGDTAIHQVLLALDRDKEQRFDPRTRQPTEKNLYVRREVVCEGQYRAFTAELRVDSLPLQDNPKLVPALKHRIAGFETLAKACNKFYLARMEDELAIHRTRRFSEGWLPQFEQVLNALKPELNAGRKMLLRVGRHSGAESVTITRHRWIQIRGGKKRPSYWSTKATTLWLAGNRISDRSGLLPFGWLLVEPADAPVHPALKAWCEAQPKPDLAAVQAKLAEARAAAQAEALRQQQLAAERTAAEAATARAEEEKAARLAAMTPNQQQVEAFISQCSARAGQLMGNKENPNGALHDAARTIAKAAHEGADWTAEEKKAAALAIEEWLPKVVKVDIKDERKKFKLAALKGQA